MTYSSEFGPEFAPPANLLNALRGFGWTDASCRHDICPSFVSTDGQRTLWCDAEDASIRELPGLRFRLTMGDEVIFHEDPEPVIVAYLVAVERARKEILADVAAGIVPASVRSFAGLHDHVDANGYGGAFEVPVEEIMGQMDLWNAVQNDLDAWLRTREVVS